MTIDQQYGNLSLKNGILFFAYRSDLHYDINTVKGMIEERLKLAEGKVLPAYIDITNLKSIDRDARQYLAEPTGTIGLSAGALITNSAISKVIGNLFLTVNKPALPFKLFTNEQEALSWLEQYR